MYHRALYLIAAALLAGCLEREPMDMGAHPEVLAQPALAQPALAQPALGQPELDQPHFDHGCKVEAPKEYRRAVRRAAAKHFSWGSIHDGECWAIGTATAESQWDPLAVSPLGYAGIFQMGEAAAAQVGVVDRFDADQNIRGGVKYLAWCVGQWAKSQIPRGRTFREAAQIGSYCFNAGPARPVEKQKERGCRYWDGCFEHYAPDETRTYVKRIATLVDTCDWYRGPHR